MTETICDICGKEMPTAKFADTIEDLNFCISSHGKIWDICAECRVSLNKWMTIRKAEREDEEYDRWCNTCEFKHLESECLGCAEYDEYDNLINLRNYKKEDKQ